MSNVVTFQITERKDRKEEYLKSKTNPMTFAVCLLSDVDQMVEHFENNMNSLPENSEYISGEFIDVVQNLQARIKTNIRYLAMNEMREEFDTVPFYDQYEILEELRFLKSNDIANLRQWFINMQIPIETSRVVKMERFRNLWK